MLSGLGSSLNDLELDIRSREGKTNTTPAPSLLGWSLVPNFLNGVA